MTSTTRASSLLLVTKNHEIQHSTPQNNDINILVVKRSQNLSNLPGHVVFPGGSFDKADESPEWLNWIPTCQLDVSLNLLDEDRKLYTYIPNEHRISQAISLRITAIRETFEECGILLCRSRDGTTPPSTSVKHYDIHHAEEWRKKVRKNPEEFLNLCRSHNCYPNIKNIHLLSNWISAFTLPKRFDAVFFMGLTKSEIETKADETETQDAKWCRVSELLEEINILLPPAQLYELRELNLLKDFSTLSKIVPVMKYFPCQAYRPVHLDSTDGLVFILPGDDKYWELNSQLNANKKSITLNCDMSGHRGKVVHRIKYARKNVIKRIAEITIENFYPRYRFILFVLSQKNKL